MNKSGPFLSVFSRFTNLRDDFHANGNVHVDRVEGEGESGSKLGKCVPITARDSSNYCSFFADKENQSMLIT